MLVSEAIAKVKDEGGLDATNSQILGWLNEAQRIIVAGAKWRMAELTIGTTINGQASYAIPDEIVDLEGVTVDGSPYTRASVKDLWNVKAGRASLRGTGGVFVPDFSISGDDYVPGIELYPVPEADDLLIGGLAALQPVTLTESDSLGVPEDIAPSLVDGAIGIGLRRMDERIPEADNLDARLQAGMQALTRRKNSRIGSGPVAIRLVENYG